jgi:cell division protease FtsH
LGGRAAEEVVFATVTNGASNDIQQATNLAKHMVALYGMSQELGLMAAASVRNQYLDGGAQLDCSQETAAKVDIAVQKLLDSCYAQSVELLRENRALLDEIAEFLLTKETITGEEMMAFVNKKDEPAAEEAVTADEDVTTPDEVVAVTFSPEVFDTESNGEDDAE